MSYVSALQENVVTSHSLTQSSELVFWFEDDDLVGELTHMRANNRYTQMKIATRLYFPITSLGRLSLDYQPLLIGFVQWLHRVYN